MERSSAAGRLLYASALAAIGCQNLVTVGLLREIQPVPASVPWHPLWACLLGVLLVVGGIGIAAGQRLAAKVLAVGMSIWMVAIWVPTLIAHPSNGGAWTGAFEIGALTSVAWVLAGRAEAGRIAFGLCLPAFGVLHFIYPEYVASVIPSWIPGPVFWTYATAVAHVAAGLAIATGVLGRLAATLLAVMFGSWVVILHAPRVAADFGSRPEWTSLLIATAMCGSALVIAAGEARRRAASRASRG
jgi:uncharacterized membrane protein